MRIADISIRQPVFITMVIGLIVVLGLVSYTRLGVDMMPDISLPIVAVTVVNPGVGPEEMESQVSKPVEDALSALNGIKNISSTSAESVAVIVAEFALEKDAQQASTEVREKITSIRNTLPREIQEPVIDKFDVSAATVVSYTITSRGQRLNLMDLRALVEDRIVQEVSSVDNVGSVTILGGLEREIHVDVDVDKLNALGLSIAQVSQAIRGENLNLPAGKVTQKDFDFILRTSEEFVRVDELLNIVVATPQGAPVYLRDVAAVSDSFKKRQAISRVNGVECISMVVRKQSGTNSVEVADGVNKTMGRVRRNFPDLEIRLATDESVAIKESRDDVINSLILGALLAGIVVLFSFGDLRNTLITIAGLPVCIIGSFAVMDLLGFSVNIITLLALSLSVGLLIDDAIVVRENIFRHMDKLGKDPRTAASDGTSEVALAVTATTLTLVAVFVPVAFATGIAGKFFRQFGLTVTAAVLISFFEAFTFAPMLSAYFFKKAKAGNEHSFSGRFQAAIARFYDRLGHAYRPVLKWSIGHRLAIVFVTLAVFAASLFLFTVVGVGGSPRGQRPEFNLVIQCTPGSSLESTERVVRSIEEILHRQKEIGDVFSIIGTKDGASDEASINVKLIRVRDNKAFQDRLRPLLSGIPGAAITFQDVMTLGGAAASSLQQLPIQINLGDQPEKPDPGGGDGQGRHPHRPRAGGHQQRLPQSQAGDPGPGRPRPRRPAWRQHPADRLDHAHLCRRRHRLALPHPGTHDRHPRARAAGHPREPRPAGPGLHPHRFPRRGHPRPGGHAQGGGRPQPDQAQEPHAPDRGRRQSPERGGPQRGPGHRAKPPPGPDAAGHRDLYLRRPG